MEKISFTKFIVLLTNQPYFIWNKINDDMINKDDNLQFNIFYYEDLFRDNLQEIQAKSFNIIDKQFNEKIAKNLNKPYFISSKKIEDRINETTIAIKNKNIETIINPVFSFIYKNFQVIAQPKIFFKKNKEINFLKISSSTKLKDILRFVFDYMVLKKNGIQIDDASLYILKTKNYKKGEVDFYKTYHINTTKVSRHSSPQDKYNHVINQLEKSGQAINKRGEFKEKYTIFQFLKMGKILNHKNSFVFKSLNTYLNKIIKAKKSNKIIFPTNEDVSIFSNNKNWNGIMKSINHEWFNYSGNLIPKKFIIANFSKKEIVNKSKVVAKILEKKILIKNKKIIIQILNKLNQNVIWYDFEAMSLPISPIDGVLPFNQVVYQASIIQTIKMKEKKIQNIVLDPQKMTSNDFAIIINAIYNENHKYVVYNRSYENTRLKEMIHFLKIKKYKNLNNLSKKVDEIIENTIDLADFFICNRNKMPMILIPELKGKYSIKIIEKYINTKKINKLYKIKKYEDLKIKNGMMAMEIANSRNLGILRNQEWEEIKNSLKEYCENDVRAMIMVYYFIKNVLKNK